MDGPRQIPPYTLRLAIPENKRSNTRRQTTTGSTRDPGNVPRQTRRQNTHRVYDEKASAWRHKNQDYDRAIRRHRNHQHPLQEHPHANTQGTRRVLKLTWKRPTGKRGGTTFKNSLKLRISNRANIKKTNKGPGKEMKIWLPSLDDFSTLGTDAEFPFFRKASDGESPRRETLSSAYHTKLLDDREIHWRARSSADCNDDRLFAERSVRWDREVYLRYSHQAAGNGREVDCGRHTAHSERQR